MINIKSQVFSGTLDDIEFPNVLYKYRDWNQEYHDRFIKNREIFLASPNSFEDKKDCKIPIRYDLLTKKQTFEYALRLSKIERPSLLRRQLRNEAREWTKKRIFKNKKKYNDFLELYFNEYNVRRGVLSLTAEPCLEEMWKKYANNSEGFCIGYNSRVLFESLGGGGKVDYYETLPLIYPEPFMDFHKLSNLIIFSKEKKWEFEKEYRTHKFWELPALIDDRQIKLPKEAFNKIILGKNISIKNRNEIIEYTNDVIGNIPILSFDEACRI